MFMNSPNHIHVSFEICLHAHYHCNAVGKIYIIYIYIYFFLYKYKWLYSHRIVLNAPLIFIFQLIL